MTAGAKKSLDPGLGRQWPALWRRPDRGRGRPADDGVFDVYSLEVEHWWKLVALLPWLRTGTQGRWGDVRAFRTTALRTPHRRPRPVNTDGELTTSTPADFRIRPKSVRVFAPKG